MNKTILLATLAPTLATAPIFAATSTYRADFAEVELNRTNVADAGTFRADFAEVELNRTNVADAGTYRADFAEAEFSHTDAVI